MQCKYTLWQFSFYSQICGISNNSEDVLSLLGCVFSLHVSEDTFDRIMSLITWQVVRNLPRQLQKSKISTAALNNCACLSVQSNPCIISLVECVHNITMTSYAFHISGLFSCFGTLFHSFERV